MVIRGKFLEMKYSKGIRDEGGAGGGEKRKIRGGEKEGKRKKI